MIQRQPIKDLYGLVLTGGKSTRMKQDKAGLDFHGKKQSSFGYELLSNFCEKVFLSNRSEQSQEEGQKGFPQIHDKPLYLNSGPIAGILSAMQEYPQVGWLILACDLPFINQSTIDYLLQHRNPEKHATAFLSAHDGLPEPLCAIYEPHAQRDLLAYYREGKSCPRKFLIHSQVELLKLPDKMALDNINLPEELEVARKILKKKKGS